MTERVPRADLRWTLTWLIVVWALGAVGIVLYGVPAGLAFEGGGTAAFKIVGVAFLVAGASFVSGCLVGFLFAIPRTVQGEEGSKVSGPSQQTQYRPNTNLEQISDWLTKILVG